MSDMDHAAFVNRQIDDVVKSMRFTEQFDADDLWLSLHSIGH